MPKKPLGYAVAFHSKYKALEHKEYVDSICKSILENFPQVGSLNIYYDPYIQEDKFIFYREYELTDFKAK